MPEQAKQMGNAKDQARLRSLIDKLVAVQLDLKPLCRDGGPRVEAHQVQTTLTTACEVLQLAIEDLREVIYHLDGGLPEIGTPTPRKPREQPPDE
jgi:signal transduction histidine kinase